MQRQRKHIPYRTRYLALVCQHFEIPHDHAKAMHPDQVESLVQVDHYPILYVHDGPDAHWNLVVRLRDAHRYKTRGDQAVIAKVKRLRITHEDVRAYVRGLLAGPPRRSRPKRKIPSRPFSKHHRPGGQ